MADETSMALEELLRKAQLSDDVDFLHEGIRVLAQALMEVEVTQHLGARRYERTAERRGEPGAERAAGARWQLLSQPVGAASPGGRWWQWCRKRMYKASQRDGWMNWRRRSD